MDTCSVCDKKKYAKGYCVAHYQRWKRHGDPFGGRITHTPEDIWERIDVGLCWEWNDSLRDGYAWINWACFDRNYAHQIIWEMLVGPIPDGLELDHLCRNRKCVNPDHLELVTRLENMRRGYAPTMVASRLGICKRGHVLTMETTYANPSKKQPNARTCSACQRDRKNARRIRHK